MTNINDINYITIPDELFSPAAFKVFDGVFEVADLEYSSSIFSFPNCVEYKLKISNAGEGLYIDGTISGQAFSTCGRCLEDVSVDIDCKVQLLYLFEAPSYTNEELIEDEVLPEDRKISLNDICISSIMACLPNKVLCSETCKGLCPNCGHNLNDGLCKCQEDDAYNDSPFAVLKEIKLED